MGRVALPEWHVWHWNGTYFDVVWHDITLTEARELTEWRNERAIAQGSPNRYVIAKDGTDPIPPGPDEPTR